MRVIARGFGTDGGEDAGREVGDLGRGREAHRTVEITGRGGERPALGTRREVRVERVRIDAERLAVEAGGDGLTDVGAVHAR